MRTSCKFCVSGSVSWGSASLLLASPSAAETTAIEEVLLWGTTPGRLAILSRRCNECDLVDKKSKFEDLLVLRCHVATGVELGQIVVCIGRTILLCLDWTLSGAPYCLGSYAKEKVERTTHIHNPRSCSVDSSITVYGSVTVSTAIHPQIHPRPVVGLLRYQLFVAASSLVVCNAFN
jgi:hypothetical protein